MEDSREELASQVRELSRVVAGYGERLSALERVAGLDRSAQPELVLSSADAGPLTPQPAVLNLAPGNLAPLFGWALLGIAGAYLLRSLTEAGAVPGLLGAVAGIAYAGWWLFLASRHAWNKPLFSTVHGLTSAAILAPMLWEVTVRFHLFSGRTASIVLVLFAVWAITVGWRHNITAIAWTGTLTAILTASALFRETHDAAAWVITALAVTAAVEFSACLNHWLSLRWMVALIADLVVVALVFMIASPPALVVGAPLALTAMYAFSTGERTLYRRWPIAWFELFQLPVACSLAIAAALRSGLNFPVGLMCITAAIACYALAIFVLEQRNFFAYSTFAILLTAAGAWLVFSGAPLVGLFAASAAATMHSRGRTFRVHATAYLVLAALGAHLVQMAAQRMIHTGTQPPASVPLAYWIVVVGALLCYVQAKEPAYSVLPAALLCWGSAGLAAGWIAAAPLRTALITALAIGVAWLGRRWSRAELVWLVYPLLVLAGVKLVAEDFQQGHSITLFASLIFFGGALILLPRLLRRPSVEESLPMIRTASQH